MFGLKYGLKYQPSIKISHGRPCLAAGISYAIILWASEDGIPIIRVGRRHSYSSVVEGRFQVPGSALKWILPLIEWSNEDNFRTIKVETCSK